MIIDIHAHFTAPDKLWVYKSSILAARSRGRKVPTYSDEEIIGALNKPVHGGTSHLEQLDEVGIDFGTFLMIFRWMDCEHFRTINSFEINTFLIIY